MTEKPPQCPRVSDEELIKLRYSCKSAEEIAEEIGRTPENVNSRINELRKAGVDVPKFPRKTRKKQAVDTEGLNNLITDLEGQQKLFDKQDQ